MPGTRVSAVDVAVGQRQAQRGGVVHRQSRQREPRPDPGHRQQSPNRSRASESAKPYSVIESSRTIIAVISRASVAAAQRRQRRRRRVDAIAHPAGLDDGVVECHVEHLAADRGDHRAAFELVPGTSCRSVRAASASAAAIRAIIGARQQWQIASARASAASAGVGLALQRKDSGDHRGDLSLVRAAVAGDRGLDLAGGVEVHVDAALRGRQRDHPAGLRGAHHRRHVLLREHPLDRDDVGVVGVHPVLDGIADGQQPLLASGASDGVRTTSTSSAMTCRPGPPSMTESPHRVSPGSTPITRTPTPPV